jgi:acetylornithine deacetylase/succinyl-diaminopimelate desuccinylase-like protein
MVSWEAVRVLAILGLRPARTVRAVVFVNEENGDRGGIQYAGNMTNDLFMHSSWWTTLNVFLCS